MIILGINYFFHDSSACLMVDGKLVVMLEEERFTRRKHTCEFPVRAIDECLKLAGMTFADVDHVAVSIKPTKDWGAKLAYGLAHLPHAKTFARHELWYAWFKQRGLKSWYAKKFGGKAVKPPIHFVPHHVAHAAGSFLASPYEEAAILSLDGSGERATSFLGSGQGLDVKCFHESYFPMSLGSFYEAATEFCGFRPNYDEGKTMGLAPFGDSQIYGKEVSDIVHIAADGAIRVDLSYFSYQFWGNQRCAERFYRTCGWHRTAAYRR